MLAKKAIQEIDRVLGLLNSEPTLYLQVNYICKTLFGVNEDEEFLECEDKIKEYFKLLSKEGYVDNSLEPYSAKISLEGQELVRQGGYEKFLEMKKAEHQKSLELQDKQHEFAELQIIKIKKELSAEITKHQKEYYEKSVEKLRIELDEKFMKAQEKMRKEQSEFFRTSVKKNKEQLWTIWIAIIISVAFLLMTILQQRN
ncbi:MAG: hypothetical protein AAFZ15_04300 [Bacteroidota bacterium]